MLQKNVKRNEKKIVLLVILIGICVLALLISQKQGFFEDEYYSYTLSNGPGMIIEFEQGKYYFPAETPYVNSMMPRSAFDLTHVWINQANDVHPPMYYLLFYLVSLGYSAFSDSFSVIPPALINCVFYAGSIYLLWHFAKEYIGNATLRLLMVIYASFCPAVLSIATLFRMYTMCMFLCLLLVYILSKKEINLVQFFFCLLCGILTHYYFAVFAAFSCLVRLVQLIWEKNYRKTGLYTIAGLASVAASFMLFPAMADHIFFGYRGQQSVDNLLDSAARSFSEYLSGYSRIISFEILGGGGIILVLIILIITMLFKPTARKQFSEKQHLFLLLAIPAFSYFILVSKISISINTRYMCLLYMSVILLLMLVTDICFDSFSYIGRLIVCALILFTITASWHFEPWEYLRRDKKEVFNLAETQYANLDCIVLYDMQWKTVSTFSEVQAYNGVQFFEYANNTYVVEDLLYRTHNGDNVIVLSACDESNTDAVIKSFKDAGLNVEYLYSDSIADSFIISFGSSY